MKKPKTSTKLQVILTKIRKKKKDFLYVYSIDARRWTAHDVELALWSYTVGKRVAPQLFEEAETPSKESDNDVESPPPLKKRKLRK